ncbi:A/G-specific adenine glycosylase [Paremcibacter congregatus]|uniref:Adenine DNA glycosylase n=1 Tax=Paremcibacter congregatus TaxID=2043170 RepID=A0A2G4YTG5_9PROT|nr:A/G-specific adenine glycosylase [Paremcibacter congregatus]PHZ85629.1 A/G-specific adenine glycosylase [Paremcibacter congregatus]QDE26589.1 A/G-specific adenine glycosylase [Paremcibacter congregatus]
MDSIISPHSKTPQDPTELTDALLDWYDVNARTLPWRIPPGSDIEPDPYHIWLSEIMLQQTTVTTVIPYFIKFLHQWPRVQDLAAAAQDDVLVAWAGLGYYARARNLHKCAQYVTEELNGIFPDTEENLLQLPGVGPYTAAAIAAIAFGQPAAVMDGNIERVMARMFNVTTPLPDAKPALKELTERMTPQHRAGDYAQAVMDLGANICGPKLLKCSGRCPWEDHCAANALGTADQLPRRKSKAPKPTRRGYAFWAEFNNHIWLCRRPENGLLGGMMEVPSTDWLESKSWDEVPAPQIPIITNWKETPGMVRHTFTHFHLELKVIRLEFAEQIDLQEGDWFPFSRINDLALPTVMMKVIHHLREPVLDL